MTEGFPPRVVFVKAGVLIEHGDFYTVMSIEMQGGLSPLRWNSDICMQLNSSSGNSTNRK